MAEIEFTDDDIEALGRKLSGLGLEGTEKALFNAVLALADNSLRNVDIPAEPVPRGVLEFDDEVEALPEPGQAFAATMAAPPASPSLNLRSVRGVGIR
jgi:hypothetical protein